MCCIQNLKGHKNVLCAYLKMFLDMRKKFMPNIVLCIVIDSKIIRFPLYCTLASKP